MAENIFHAGHTIDDDHGGIRILHWVPEHCRDAAAVHGKRSGAILFAIDGHAGVAKIHELVKGNCDGHVLSAGIGSRRGRDALNDGAVRVHQAGGGVAGLGGGGGILGISIYILQIQYCCFSLFCVVDCREMLTVLPLLIVQFGGLVSPPLIPRGVPLNMYSVRQNGA